MKTLAYKALLFVSLTCLIACGDLKDAQKLLPKVTIQWPSAMFDNVTPDPDHVQAPQLPTGYQEGQPVIVGPSQNDVRQGTNGDCWLDATLAALALHRPQAIINSIADTNLPDTWQVTLFDATQGHKPTKMLVKKSDFWGNPAASRPNGAVIWPLILEAAFVQLNDRTHYFGPGQGFMGLNGGVPNRAMETMTGSATGTWWMPWVNQNSFAAMLDGQTPAVLCTRQTTPVKTLVGGHCYTVIGGDGKTFTVRNPWGVSYSSPDGYEKYSMGNILDGFAIYVFPVS